MLRSSELSILEPGRSFRFCIASDPSIGDNIEGHHLPAILPLGPRKNDRPAISTAMPRLEHGLVFIECVIRLANRLRRPRLGPGIMRATGVHGC